MLCLEIASYLKIDTTTFPVSVGGVLVFIGSNSRDNSSGVHGMCTTRAGQG